jgi:putative transposase
MTDESSASMSGAEAAEQLAASGGLDALFAKIDSGEVALTGSDGLLPGLLKAALERGLQVELDDHLGYERGDPAASLFPNSRNGTSPKTVASEVGDVTLDVPRDRDGTFSPQMVPRFARRLGGLDDMIISLYAGGMTLRGIAHHLLSTLAPSCRRRRSRRSSTRSARRCWPGNAGR